MADLPPSRDSNRGTGNDTGTPRWVYAFGLIAIVLALLFVILHLAGGGLGGHAPS